jgi:hypothetical protein
MTPLASLQDEYLPGGKQEGRSEPVTCAFDLLFRVIPNFQCQSYRRVEQDTILLYWHLLSNRTEEPTASEGALSLTQFRQAVIMWPRFLRIMAWN